MSLSGKTPFLAFVHCSCCASPGELFHYLTAQQRPPYLCKNPGSLNPWNNRIGIFKFRMQKERQAPMLYKDFSYMETFLLLIQFFWSIEAFLLWRSVWTKLQATARLDTEAELWRAKIQFLHIRLFSCYISLPVLKIRKAANPKKNRKLIFVFWRTSKGSRTLRTVNCIKFWHSIGIDSYSQPQGNSSHMNVTETPLILCPEEGLLVVPIWKFLVIAQRAGLSWLQDSGIAWHRQSPSCRPLFFEGKKMLQCFNFLIPQKLSFELHIIIMILS